MSVYTDIVDRRLENMEACSPGISDDCRWCYDYHNEDNLGPASWVKSIHSNRPPRECDDFSIGDCDVCGTSMAGERIAGHYLENQELIRITMCVDGVLYLCNGDIPEYWEG